jgi:hypothetical protein
MALLLQLRQKLAHGFQALWVRYPNKSAKKDAEKAYAQVVKTPEIDQEVHSALDWQIPEWATMEWYRPPYLATYLRKERFRDERQTTTPSRTPARLDQTPTAVRQLDATARIRSLVQAGVDYEDAKIQVYKAMGWIK